MAARSLKIAGLALWASTTAVQLPYFLNPSGTAAAASSVEASPPLDGAALQILLPFIVMEALIAAIPFVYRRAQHHGAGAGGGRRLSELLVFFLCVVVGLLELFLFVKPAGGAVDGGAQARALGFAGLRAQARLLGRGARLRAPRRRQRAGPGARRAGSGGDNARSGSSTDRHHGHGDLHHMTKG